MATTTAERLPRHVLSASTSGAIPPLVAVAERTQTSLLEPLAFFVSWQGVVTLAYKGFTPALLDLKSRLDAAMPHLPSENPGSKWPKTSLGCLLDDQRLTPEQLQLLNRICKDESKALQDGQPLKIALDSSAVVLYECRSLERVLTVQHVAFQGGASSLPASEEEQQRVRGIVAEADAEGYWVLASRDGNRKQHYTGPHLGATLMHPLAITFDGCESPAGHVARPGLQQRGLAEIADRERLLVGIRRFRRRVEEELGGLYYWFDDASLHITIRALIN